MLHRKAIKVILTLAALPAMFALMASDSDRVVADVNYSDSWGCEFLGETYFYYGGHAYTYGDLGCVSVTMVRLHYFNTSTSQWVHLSYNYQSGYYASQSAANASALQGEHQVYVTGYGYGQVEWTSE